MRSTPLLCRALLLAGALLVGLQACGRRGPPERPDLAAAAAAAEAEGKPAPKPALPPGAARESREGHVVPKQPFILDPLL
jgi:predicted small lipoprotein YifL